MKKRILASLCLTALAMQSILAQGPNGSGAYYRNADGKSGKELKTAFHNIIAKKERNPGYDELLELYKTTDTRSDGKVRDWYSNITNFVHIKDKAGNYKKEGDVYNREHLVPQSWGAPKSDIVHVVPTDGYVNNKRGNLPLGEVGTPNYQSANSYSKSGTCKTPGYTGVVFEPNDEVKGDIARIYFYMATCYEGTCQKWGNSVFTGDEYQPLAKWTYDMMVRWSRLDPVDDVERGRNKAIARSDVQGNRNPFVDYPGLEEYIWGSKKDVPFSYDNYDAEGDIAERVGQPQFSPAEGRFTDKVVVTISTETPQATIYYTTDGSDASTNSNEYQEPLTLSKTTTLKAIAVKDGMKTSLQQTATYTISSSQQGTVNEGEVAIALNSSTLGTVTTGKTDYSAEKDGVSVTYSKGTSANQYISESQIRIYAGNTLTVSCTDGYVTEVEFNKVGGKGDKVMQATEGTVSDMTWKGETQTVTFSVNSGSGHLQLSGVKVITAKAAPEPVRGDVNGDGAVDVADVASIISVMAGETTGTATPAKADVNGDRQVDVADIASVITIMAGGDR